MSFITQHVPLASLAKQPAAGRGWRPSIEIEQVRASWTTADRLFSAVRRGDAQAALQAYGHQARIINPIIGRLTTDQLAAALDTFVRRTPGYELSYEIRQAGPRSAEVAWSIRHVLFVTGRRIEISGMSHLVFERGQIVLQHDDMATRDWTRQALGLKGLILAWLPGWRRFVEREMRYSLGVEERAP